MRRPWQPGWALVLALLAGVACHEASKLRAGELRVPIARLADPVAEPGGADIPSPTALILEQIRPVLAGPTRGLALWGTKVVVPPDRRIALSGRLPASMAHATRVAVLPLLALKDGIVHLPPIPVEPVLAAHGGRIVRVEFSAPESAVGAQIVVNLECIETAPIDLARFESRAVPIPESAQLEFGFGVLVPEASPDAVAFSIEACEAAACQTIFDERFEPQGEEPRGWQDREVSLARFAGRTIRFRILAERLAHAGPISLPVWSNPVIYASAPRQADQRNVILLSIDTLRADHLTPYGYARETSPFLEERFGRQGVVFENAVASSTTTTPAHMAIFTGLPPTATGVIDGFKTLAPGFVTLPELARASGITTGAVTEGGFLAHLNGFGSGFDSYLELRSPDGHMALGQVERNFANAKSWLARNRDKHFFLFLHTYQVHWPYAPPAEYGQLFSAQSDEPPPTSPPLADLYSREYDREIRYVDDQLRSLAAEVDRLGLTENTVWIVLSDHGEEFLEHGRLQHGSQNYQEALHVPLLLSGRGIPHGRRIADLVGHTDLLPSVLELLGVPLDAKRRGDSLLRLVDGSANARFEGRILFSESWASLALDDRGWIRGLLVPAFSARQGDRKVARVRTDSGARYEYYDLARDPGERQDLYPERAVEAADLVARLDRYEADARALADAAVRARSEAPPDAPDAAIPLDVRRERELRALGYIE